MYFTYAVNGGVYLETREPSDCCTCAYQWLSVGLSQSVFSFYSFPKPKQIFFHESRAINGIIVGGGSYRDCLLWAQYMNNHLVMHASGVVGGGTTTVEKGRFCFE